MSYTRNLPTPHVVPAGVSRCIQFLCEAPDVPITWRFHAASIVRATRRRAGVLRTSWRPHSSKDARASDHADSTLLRSNRCPLAARVTGNELVVNEYL